MLVLKNAIRRDMPYLNNHIATLLVIYRSIITYNHIGLLLDYVRLCIVCHTANYHHKGGHEK